MKTHSDFAALSRSAWIPQDRRISIARGAEILARAWGVVLFADITGFTPLTERLVAQHGRRSGADALVRLLNQVYPPLIAAVEARGGSVIGFSGDALTCWFAPTSNDELTTQKPVAEARQQTAFAAALAAAAMQQTMREVALALTPTDTSPSPGFDTLAIRITITSGEVDRILVGDPALYVLDALAGAPLDRISEGDHAAQRGEILLDKETWQTLDQDEDFGGVLPPMQAAGVSHFSVHRHPDRNADEWYLFSAEGMEQRGETLLALPEVDENSAAPWILPVLRSVVSEGAEELLAELRPAVALFVRFGGIDFADAAAPAQLQTYIRWAQGVVHHYDGSLIQVTTGDKGAYFYAVFGAPVAHDNDVERALLAASSLVNPPPECSFITATQVGVSDGVMRVGAYGGPTRRTYGVQGESVNIAARLMSAAEAGTILVTESIAEVISTRGRSAALPLAAESAGSVWLKGKSAPTPIYRVQPIEGTRFAANTERYVTALVGREEELRAIATTLAAIGAQGEESGRLIVLEGPAGIGKSHLMHQAVLEAQRAGWEILHSASHSTTQGTPFAAARQFMRALLGLERPTTAKSAFKERGEDAVLALLHILPSAEERAPLLNDLLGIALPESEFTRALDARTRQDALIALLIEVIQARAMEARLLFVLEDSHWLDESSAGIISALLAMLEHALVAAMTSVRPNLLPVGIRASDSLTLHLQIGDLSTASITALVGARLGGAVDSLAIALILTQSQGNPFFAEEFTDALLEAGSLMRETSPDHGGALSLRWRLSQQTLEALRSANCLVGEDEDASLRADARLTEANLGVPNSISGILLARLDRLPDTARLALKVASVMGRSFSLALLQRVRLLESHRDELTECLRLALLRDFVRVEEGAERVTEAVSTGQSSDASPVDSLHNRFYFRHNLIRDVVYNTLLDAQQRDLHEQVALALAQVQPGATAELAHHYYRSDTSRAPVRERAVTYLAAAAHSAQSDYANETALTFFRRALELTEDADLHCRMVEVLHILGRREEEADALQRLTTLQERSGGDKGNPALVWETARLWAEYHESLGDYPQAEQWLQRALVLAWQQDDEPKLARVQIKLATISWRQGEFDHAHEALQLALTHANTPSAVSERADALYAMGLVNRQQARFEEAQRCFAEDLALRSTSPNPEREARALNALGNMRAMLRDPVGALDYFQRALAIRRDIGDRTGVGSSLLAIGQCYSSMARLAEAEEILREALRIQRATRNRFQECLVGNELGIVQWLCGQYAAAEATLQSSLAIARALESTMLESYVLCNLGQVQRDAALALNTEQAGNANTPTPTGTAQAIATLERGLSMALEQEDLQLAAIYQSDLALALHIAGEQNRALQSIDEAERTYRSIAQEKELTTVLPTRARILLAMGERADALVAAHAAIALLDAATSEPPEFAHRDYHYSGMVLAVCGEEAAALRAFAAAKHLLLHRAEQITSDNLRESFLHNVPHNRAILAA